MERETDQIHPNASEFIDFEENYALINEIQIYYEYKNVSVGAKGNAKKTAVLLVHGWTANRLRLHPLYLHFMGKGTSVFRLDLRGCGWSQKEAINDFSINKMSEDVELFIKEIMVKKFGFSSVILIGHSMGGNICMKVANSIPLSIKRLILLSSSAYWTGNVFGRFKLALYSIYYRFNYWKRYNGKKKGHAVHGLEHFPMWSNKYRSNGRTLFTAREATIQGIKSIGSFDVRKEIKTLTIPTLIVVGTEDIDAPPKLSKNIHELIPNSTLVIIPGVNHDLVIGKPISLAKIIDNFLENS